jgi:hypothetical protein
MICYAAMTNKLHYIDCPAYTLSDNMDLNAVSQCIDSEIRRLFTGQEILLRGIQSGKHSMPKEHLIQDILSNGTDKITDDRGPAGNDGATGIDIHASHVVVSGQDPLTHFTLRAFHEFKPKAQERPKLRVDIWMIYNPSQLDNIEYLHPRHHVIARDGYRFKNPNNKTDALLGLIVIN